MDAISMLPPGKRCVRSKMALFLRLWVVRHRYEQLRPFGRTADECLEFHLEQLRESWERVLACQRALGLEVRPFSPEERFEAIYIVSGYVDRALKEVREERPELGALWRAYLGLLDTLSHDGNPFEFGERCQDCLGKVASVIETFKSGFVAAQPQDEPIRFEKALAGLRA